MPRVPPKPPHGTVQIGSQTYPVTLSQAVLDWLLDGVYTNETNIGSVNSGIAQVRADTAAAQAAADAANQQASDVAAASLAFSASVDPFSAVKAQYGTGAYTTNEVTVTPSGGTGPYTYSWAYVSGDATLTTDAPTSATTTWTGTINRLGQDKSAVYRCTVTDSAFATTSVTVSVSISELS